MTCTNSQVDGTFETIIGKRLLDVTYVNDTITFVFEGGLQHTIGMEIDEDGSIADSFLTSNGCPLK